MNLDLQERCRSTYIGGSEVAAVLGVDGAFDTPFAVWARRQPEFEEDLVHMTPAMEAGHRFEEAVMDWSGAVLGATEMIRGEPFGGKVVVGPEAFTACHPDGYMKLGDEWYVYEGKLSQGRAHEYSDSGSMPDSYLVQWIWEQLCTKMPGAFGAQISLREPPWTRIMGRDEGLEEILVSKVGDWWHKHIELGEAPPVDGSTAASSWVKKRYRSHSDIVRHPAAPEAELIAELDRVKSAMSKLKKKSSELENKLKDCIGVDEGIFVGGGPQFVSWRSQKGPSRLNTKRLKADRPDIYKAFVEASTNRRVLRAHPAWGKLTGG